MNYITFHRIGNEWQFQLRAPNHEALMTSERYKTRAAMRKAIEAVVNRKVSRRLKFVEEPNREDI